MSLHPQAFCPVPEETVRVARAAYPKGNVYLQVRDELGTIYTDQSFAELFPKCGQPAEAPWRFLLVSLMQFAEGLSDRQAADAVRGRLDWKYQLGLELTDPGFDASVLSECACTIVGRADRTADRAAAADAMRRRVSAGDRRTASRSVRRASGSPT